MGIENREDHHIVRSQAGTGETFADIMQRRISRRTVLKGAVAASTVVIATPALANTIEVTMPQAETPRYTLGFDIVSPQPAESNEVMVPADYSVQTLLRWGDPLTAEAPEFDAENMTAEAQEQQFGYNCDFVGFLPLELGSNSSDRGLLVVNHEYTNPELMFAGYDVENPQPTQEIVDVELAAHGVTVVEIVRDSNGEWSYDRNSQYNRRYTATSPMTISGPAANHEWLQTSADATGQDIRGTLNNCAGGKTPWGTVVTAEENFHQYFANLGQLPDDEPRKAVHDRYGIPEEASERRWENFYDRFDVSKEPNEPFRHGWAVEIDPYDPQMTPIKRTTIGRFRHEAQTFVVAPSGQVAVYSGDDARFEYVYKFVTDGTFSSTDRTANMSLLDTGTLYVAKFNEDGTGEWMPLIFGEGPLTEANGFTSQGDVLIKTRLAGDALGATKMDRPEDIEPNPVNQKIYIALTNNTNREEADIDAANPRAENRYGHVIELTEDGDDHTATTFAWDIFLLCGNPEDESTFFAGFDKSMVSPIANPDNVAFDNAGNLWIATDGQPGTLEYTDALFAVPVEGENRGFVQQFFSSVNGSEVCGPEFTPDNTSLFLAIQHPGEGGTFDEPTTSWPGESGPPRPSVIAIRSNNGTPIGQTEVAAPATTEAAPATGDTTDTTDTTAPADGATGGDSAADAPSTLPTTGGAGNPAPWMIAAGAAAAAAGAFLRRRSKLANGAEAEDEAQDEAAPKA
ncbi:MAG: PhoX family phosphatase [Chloroflexaceae bacterium]|nr:PhoX family phosphatase [Chloroflexaceae bacterium]